MLRVLCDANDARSFALIEDNVLRLVAHHGLGCRQRRSLSLPISRGIPPGRAVLDRQTIHVHDLSKRDLKTSFQPPKISSSGPALERFWPRHYCEKEFPSV